MSKKNPEEQVKYTDAEGVDYRNCGDVSEILKIVGAFMCNNQSPRSLKVVKKNDAGTDVLSVEITPK